VNQLGTVIYSTTTFNNLKNGEAVPCAFGGSVTVTSHLICYIETGLTSDMTKPIRIFVTNFVYTTGSAAIFSI
jgi:hypothetical protein